MPEEWGGDVPYVNISAKQGTGIDELLETVTVVAELAELKANPKRMAYGSVIEGRLDKGRGPVATLLIQNGTLRSGNPIVVGATYGRVRQLVDDRGREIKAAGPATPVEITGLNDVPEAGDKFMVFETEREARHVGEERAQKKIEEERNSTSAMSLDDLFSQMKSGEVVDLNIIVKADVASSQAAHPRRKTACRPADSGNHILPRSGFPRRHRAEYPPPLHGRLLFFHTTKGSPGGASARRVHRPRCPSLPPASPFPPRTLPFPVFH